MVSFTFAKLDGREVNQVNKIPKPNSEEGLGISWPQQKTDMDKLKVLLADIKSKM